MMLYEIDLSAMLPDAAIDRFWGILESGEALELAPPYEPPLDTAGVDPVIAPDHDVKTHAEALVRGCTSARDELDGVIQKVSQNWRLDRMACVDRNLLRLGAYEIMRCADDVPRKVAINEAVEIAKRFGSAESSAFINGVLDRLGK